jgi:hypothetical protein
VSDLGTGVVDDGECEEFLRVTFVRQFDVLHRLERLSWPNGNALRLLPWRLRVGLSNEGDETHE